VSTGTQTQVVMPQMGVSVSEGTITKWLKQVGEPIAQDEPLLEISTDKVDTEIPSPGEGVVTQILVPEGETVDVGTVLALIGPAGSQAAEPAPAETAPAAPAPVEAGAVEATTPAPVPAAAPAAAAPQPQAAESTQNGKSFVSPVVARIAAEHGVDPTAVPGTGNGGRVTKKDILAYIESGASAPAPVQPAPAEAAPEPAVVVATPVPAAVPEPVAITPTPAPPPMPVTPAPVTPAPVTPAPVPPAPVPPAPVPPAPTPTPTPAPAPVAASTESQPELLPGEALEPMTAMRRGVMDHMRRSLDTSAHVTSAIEVDMARVVALRQKLKPEFAEQGVSLTYLAFIARATVETIREYPWINGELRGQSIVTRPFVNLGIAVALDEGKGLIVPVIRNAQDLNLQGMARAIQDLAERARTKKLLPDDVQGGTFTVTNPGSFGTFHGTPIINQPQAAILGTYALVKRPWVVQDELGNDVIAIRPLMNLTLTYDHRLVDGAYAGLYLHDLRQRLESWDEAAY
jgi:pyruvate/2-oxoglutarate dehydrogenase complex dihydrolipoamide acyltransferase (E2) component